MEKECVAETGSSIFFGDYLYEREVPPRHFTRKTLRLYNGGGLVGRPPFDPALVLKMALFAFLYNLSDRQVEGYVNENLPAKYFVGLAVDEQAPNHSALTVFCERLVQRGKEKAFEEMLEEIIQIAMKKGIVFGSTQIMDGVHSAADVNTDKNRRTQSEGGASGRGAATSSEVDVEVKTHQ